MKRFNKIIAVCIIVMTIFSIFTFSTSAATSYHFNLDVNEYAFSNSCKKDNSYKYSTIVFNNLNTGYNTPYLYLAIYSRQINSSTYRMSTESIAKSNVFNLDYSKTPTTNNNYYLYYRAERRVVIADGYWYS